MQKKSARLSPRFPAPHEALAGALTPNLFPGPITASHPHRLGGVPAQQSAPAPEKPNSQTE
jgi:hypothetical protein